MILAVNTSDISRKYRTLSDAMAVILARTWPANASWNSTTPMSFSVNFMLLRTWVGVGRDGVDGGKMKGKSWDGVGRGGTKGIRWGGVDRGESRG